MKRCIIKENSILVNNKIKNSYQITVYNIIHIYVRVQNCDTKYI